MPQPLTYPGVYVEEISSGVRTITGVATSITAFIGRAEKGPLDTPVTINNFGDYERVFGGLENYSSMSYAVRDYYLNGGGQAVIVRLFSGDVDATTAKITIDGLTLKAASPGEWGNKLYVAIDLDVSEELEEQLGVTLFNLTIGLDAIKDKDRKPTKVIPLEKHINITVEGESERRIDKVLAAQSSLLECNLGDSPPVIEETEEPQKAEDGNDGDEKGLSNMEFTDEPGLQNQKKGLYTLEKADLFNLLCIPPYQGFDDNGKPDSVDKSVIGQAAVYCKKRRAMLIVDPPKGWLEDGIQDVTTDTVIDERSENAALFFPRLKQPNPRNDNRIEEFAPCGAVAGIIARTDAERGVWKAPAGLDATLRGVPELSVKLTDDENGQLNPRAINCLRSFPNVGRVIWGARTLKGDDNLGHEYKYLPVRRLALFIEESLFRGTQWVVFEPNDEPLWSQIRLNVGSFMHTLFRQGAFQGSSPKQAYFVKCDKETTPQSDIDRGIVNIAVGFAPLKPAEFVVIKLQQIAGDLEF